MHQNIEREFVGKSASLRAVLQQVDLVAPADCAVLIQGETGTGKELIARAIHARGPRANGPFVTLNCAAIPGELLESELFGCERGAFTGAVSQRIGRLQAAHKGTLMLDEIGELPLELQPKLLRALEEQEFQRLGSSQTIRVDVRFVAATNRDLGEMVNERRFRADLYYRLNVFPITSPPLRERKEDIPGLTWHFVQEYSRRMNKIIDEIPPEVMEALLHHDWPGNIRELQNVVERSVVVSRGPGLRPALDDIARLMPANLRPATLMPARRSEPGCTLQEMERLHIRETLEKTNWVVGGRAGAAAKLGLPRTTLMSRMRKLGISRGGAGLAAVPDAPDKFARERRGRAFAQAVGF